MLDAVGRDSEEQSSLDAMLPNIITSLARRLGIVEAGRTSARSEQVKVLNRLLDDREKGLNKVSARRNAKPQRRYPKPPPPVI
jgi:hypothetical protein